MIYTARSFTPSCPHLLRASTSFFAARKQDVDGRDIGERSDAVLRTAMPGHDGEGAASAGWAKASTGPRKARPDDKLRAVPTRSFAEADQQIAATAGQRKRVFRRFGRAPAKVAIPSKADI
jgi:hypothetical protein